MKNEIAHRIMNVIGYTFGLLFLLYLSYKAGTNEGNISIQQKQIDRLERDMAFMQREKVLQIQLNDSIVKLIMKK